MGAGSAIGMKAISIVIGIPVGIATKKVVERAWIAARPDDPPRQPKEDGVRWPDAIAWAAVSAAGIVLAELVTRRSAEATFRALTGSAPPPGKPPKSHKKAGASDTARAAATRVMSNDD
jgi:hypothetical protein